VNIAGVVRAMKNMGVQALSLVRPVEYDPSIIERIAHDTRDLVAGIQHFDQIDDALARCVRVVAYSARRRAAKWRTATPRVAALELLAHASAGSVALVFGREESGLPNEVLDRANIVVTIPTTEHASLNLAQAVMIALYEVHVAAGSLTREIAAPRKDAPPPSAIELERFFGDANRALEALDFYKTRNPELIMRTLRSLTFRATPDARELQLVRAMALEVLRTINRIRMDRT